MQYLFFLKFSNPTAGILSQTLWFHSLHWLHCAILHLSSVGCTYGSWHRQYDSTFEVAVSLLTTSSVIVVNGVSFPIFRDSTSCSIILFFIITFFFWIATIRHTGSKRYGINSTVDTVTLLLHGRRQYCQLRARMVCVGCYLCSNIFRYMFLL